MSEVTRILSAIEQGNPHEEEQLLPLVYEELRQLAAQRLGRTADIAWLEADLHQMSAAPEQAITISTRLRIRPPVSRRRLPSRTSFSVYFGVNEIRAAAHRVSGKAL